MPLISSRTVSYPVNCEVSKLFVKKGEIHMFDAFHKGQGCQKAARRMLVPEVRWQTGAGADCATTRNGTKRAPRKTILKMKKLLSEQGSRRGHGLPQVSQKQCLHPRQTLGTPRITRKTRPQRIHALTRWTRCFLGPPSFLARPWMTRPRVPPDDL